MKLADFHYELPAEAIAQEPRERRDQSRLLVLDRQSKTIRHKRFSDIVEFLTPGDVLVLNSTRVFPARLRGRKKSGGKIEVLLLSQSGERSWRALVRGTAKASDLIFPENLEAHMRERLTEGEWTLEFADNHIREYLDRHGEMPLPPYIKRPAPRAQDLERYQTVYAETEGAVAAPTAGFHFTPDLLEKVRAKGILVQSIVLHVGWGTFRPVRAEAVEDHAMLPESYEVTDATAHQLNQARQNGGRIIAVGTTAVRTLETICDTKGTFHSSKGESNLFIYPGYSFKGVDALITNFHLPDSTPLLLACAFYGGSKSEHFSLKPAYQAAIQEKYRFYSFGDAMFIA